MTNVDDAKRDDKFKAACEEYVREAMADGLNREQVLAKLEEITKIAFGAVDKLGSAAIRIASTPPRGLTRHI